MHLEGDIIKNLGRLPKTLEATYAQTLQTMMDQGTPHEWGLTRRAMMWIMSSRTPFTKELWIEVSYWPHNIPKDGAEILFTLCHNMVTWDSQLGVVKFAHLSVQEHLESKLTTATDAHSMATECCLSLLDSWYRPGGWKLTTRPPRKEFIDYATRYWIDHIQGSYSPHQHMNAVVLETVKGFLGTSIVPGHGYCKWLESISGRLNVSTFGQDFTEMVPHLKSRPVNPLFAACYFQFARELHWLWEGRYDINARNSRGETLLFVASIRGNEWAVNVLLRKGADINSGSSSFGSCPLVAAIKQEQLATTFQLIDRGARAPGVGKGFEVVALEGSEEFLEAAMNRDQNFKTTEAVLMAAAGNLQFGIEAMIMFLAKDPSKKITEPVMVAAARNVRCSERLISMLLDRDPNIKITESVAIAAAGNSQCGRELMKLLLARNPSLKITTAIMTAAAGSCDKDTMAELLARDPNIQVAKAVTMAAAKNVEYGAGVMEIILDRTPDIKITSGIVKAAAENPGFGREMVEILHERKDHRRRRRALSMVWK